MDNAIIVSVPYRGYSFFNFPRLQTIYDAPDSKVSVPYRGYSFFNTPTKTSQTKQKQSVSVPYRGYSFFNLFLVSLYCLFLFPSLTGVIRFLIIILNGLGGLNSSGVSVPYRGYSFFNFNEKDKRKCNKHKQWFPSLTGVIRFLIKLYKTVEKRKEEKSFRPLQGLFVF